LFFILGEVVAVMHGANAPLMKIMIAEQMERERRIQAGEELRRGIPIHEAVPGTKLTPCAQSIIVLFVLLSSTLKISI
jgi:hypothetical protein